ncbi:hypothetical protein BYT27DRAFT_7195256 [Phlegmacium glaucopus]|nr:hypothetical protein BYT27DRAFT_7195256 [Phlegmacium glaucopus]
MSKRPPNELESRLHQAALSTSKNEITAKQAESIIPNPTARQSALNFLLAVGLFKSLTSSSGQLIFRAVTKEEIVATKGLTGEENLVLSHIKISGNEGIWTKHLKAKTNLHQTVIDRCLKTLTQKRLIKRVPSVQHITRKIYMLEGLEPSIALTGGPWYTDNELDTEFIQNLTEACYKFISDISFPKGRNASVGALYPISNPPKYPSAESIRNSLRKARLTETDLTVEHVEMLLNVLILDGKIEKIPSFGAALWNSDATGNNESGEDEHQKERKKRKHWSDDSEEDKAPKKKKRKDNTSEENETSEDNSSRKKSKGKRSKGKYESGSDQEQVKKRKKKQKKNDTDSESSSSDDTSRKKSKKKKKKRGDLSSDRVSDSDSEADYPVNGKSKSMKRSQLEVIGLDSLDTSVGNSVYRALKESTTPFAWTESPCGVCPSFEFCRPGGPVNPQECVYYDDWLTGGTVSNDIEE